MRLQISLEFILVFSFVLILFLFIFATIANQRALLVNQQVFANLQVVASKIAQQINIAVSSGNGYTANMPLTEAFGINIRNITITSKGVVIVYAKYSKQTLDAVAYSNAGKVITPSSVSTNYLSIQNSFGQICVDTDCPNSSEVVSNIYLKSQVTHVAQFNGQSSYINTSYSQPLSSFSVSFWFDPSRPGTGVGQGSYSVSPLSTIPGCNNKNEWWIEWRSSGSFELGSFSGTGAYDPVVLGYITKLNQWYNVVIDYNTSTGAVTSYLNGEPLGHGTAGVWSSSSSCKLYIGTGTVDKFSTSAYDQYYQGRLGNVQIYDTILSQANASSIYNKGLGGYPIPGSGLAAWYPLNGNANDYTGSNNGNTFGPVTFPTAAEILATVVNGVGTPLQNVLVGFSTTLGNFTNSSSYANYTNSQGVAHAFLNQYLSNGYADVKAVAYDGNQSAQNYLNGWWPLNSGSGNLVNDVSGNGNTGNTLGVSWNMPSYVAKFDGKSGYINITASSSIPSINGAKTVSAWVYLTSTSGIQDIVSLENYGSGAADQFRVNDSTLSVSMYGGNTIASVPFTSTNGWHMVSYTYSGGTTTLYVDGVAQLPLWTTTVQSASTNYIMLGNYAYNGNEWLSGSLSNVQIYNGALTGQQLYKLYSMGISAPPISSSVVGWWPLDGNANDYINNQNGTISGGVSFISPSIQSTNSNSSSTFVATFNGQNSSIKSEYNASTSPSQLTVSAWVLPLQTNGDRGIIGQGDLGKYNWQLKVANGHFDFVIYGVVDNNFGYIAPNTLSFVTATYNSGKISLYVNGAFVKNYTESSVLNTYKPLYMGYTPNDAAPIYFNGSISNVQIYNSVLNPSQVSSLYKEGISGAPLPHMGVVDWYPLDGNANDYSSTANYGIASNVVFSSYQAPRPSVSSSLNGYGLGFNGYSSSVDVPTSNTISPTKYMSLLAWVNLNSQKSAVLQKTNSYGIKVGVGGAASGQLASYIWGTNGVCSNYPYPLNAGSWYLVGFTFNGTVINQYVDGNPYCSIKFSGTIPASSSSLALGGPQDTDGYLNGSIADVQLYNASLTDQQVYQIYANGVPPSASTTIPLSVLP